MKIGNMTGTLIAVICIFMVIAPATCDITFTLKTDNYGTFVQQVRNAVKSPTLVYHGLPMISPPSTSSKYLYVNLIAKNTNNQPFTIGLQLKKADLYVVAFRDQADNANRAFYFSGLVSAAEVFTNIPNINRQQTKVAHDYDSLEGAAGQLIKDLQLGITSLESVMRNIYGRKDTTTTLFKRDQARFALTAIVSVAEAARFKYIEKKVDYSLKSDYEVRSLVTHWGALSTQIAQSNAAGVFRNPVRLQVAANRYWDITNVNQIKPDIGILKYVAPRSRDSGFAYAY